MSLKDELSLSDYQWTGLIRKGAISCSFVRVEEIVAKYQARVKSGIGHTEAVAQTADEMRCSTQWVYSKIREHK